MKILVKFYDGKSSKEHMVFVKFSKDRFEIEDFNIKVDIKDIEISSRLGSTPRVIQLPDGSRCKISDNNKLDRILRDIGYKQSLIHQIESSWRFAVGSLVIVIFFIIFMLTAGADYTSKFLADILPKDTLVYISQKSLEELDKEYFQKSRLSDDEKRRVKKSFHLIGDYRYQILFRSSKTLGANAFALPDGRIVILDDLIELDRSKNYYGVLGILAHEKAHIDNRHSIRILIKNSIAISIMGYITGDISLLATMLPSLMITAKYSREFEKEADIYAKNRLKELNISTKYLAYIFKEIDKRVESKGVKSVPAWLLTHPSTPDRIKFFMDN